MKTDGLFLITGAAGRIGRRTVEALLARGKSVCGADLVPSGIRHPAYREVVGSLLSAGARRRALRNVGGVAHLAAMMSWNPADAGKMFQMNVAATRALAEDAASMKIRRFVFASSGEVYPENRPLRLPVTERHPTRPNTPYGLSKLLGEEIVSFHGRRGDFESVILRFSHAQNAAELLDPNSFFSGPRFFLRPRIRREKALGNSGAAAVLEKLDDGHPRLLMARNEDGSAIQMTIADARDIAAGVALALLHPKAAGGVFNLGPDSPVDFARLLPFFSRATGLPIAEAVMPGQHVRYNTSCAKIRKALNFAPQWPMEKMTKEAARVWRKNGDES